MTVHSSQAKGPRAGASLPRVASGWYGTALLALVLSLVTVAHASAHGSLQPSGWDNGVQLPEARDLNPDPNVVEINLEARLAQVEIAPGTKVEAWTYDGGLPGPLIRGQVGNRLIVHFSNRLPAPTTVHWHGLRVPIEMDGVPNVSQPEVEPGQSFTYDFVLRDAGLYWYHPHVMSAAQVGFGLYGALLVDDPTEAIGVADELVLVLSDIAIDVDGRLEAADGGGTLGMVLGREGNHVLVNGRQNSRLIARNGAPQRWRIVNAAKSRHFDLVLDGLTFLKIGGDGGLQEYPQSSDRVNLAAGERADVIVIPRPVSAASLQLVSIPFNRGFGSVEFRGLDDLLTIDFADMPPFTAPPLPKVGRSIEPLTATNATPVKIELTIGNARTGKYEFGINGVPFALRKPVLAKLGETQLWTVTNTTKWSHPMHLHGFSFQVLDETGQPARPLAWKDTVNVPFDKTVRFLVRFDERPGDWMYHCHILDHADGGMMGFVGVGTSGAAASHLHHSGPSPENHSGPSPEK